MTFNITCKCSKFTFKDHVEKLLRKSFHTCYLAVSTVFSGPVQFLLYLLACMHVVKNHALVTPATWQCLQLLLAPCGFYCICLPVCMLSRIISCKKPCPIILDREGKICGEDHPYLEYGPNTDQQDNPGHVDHTLYQSNLWICQNSRRAACFLCCKTKWPRMPSLHLERKLGIIRGRHGLVISTLVFGTLWTLPRDLTSSSESLPLMGHKSACVIQNSYIRPDCLCCSDSQ